MALGGMGDHSSFVFISNLIKRKQVRSMYVCPLCNGLKTFETNCPSCSNEMQDKGRVVDYLDDYSPYLEDEGLKAVDGVKDSRESHLCIHLTHCENCGFVENIKVEEQFMKD